MSVCLCIYTYILSLAMFPLLALNFLLLSLLFRKNAWFSWLCGVCVEAGVDTVVVIY